MNQLLEQLIFQRMEGERIEIVYLFKFKTTTTNDIDSFNMFDIHVYVLCSLNNLRDRGSLISVITLSNMVH